MKKAVILLSGGLDSTTCLAYALDAGYDCHAISFDYGQRNRAELIAAQQIATSYAITEHRIVTLSLGDFTSNLSESSTKTSEQLRLTGSALTDSQLEVPAYQGSNTIPTTYVPARNTVFLSIALGWAEVLNAAAIFIGVSAVDYSGYPDCRPEYIAAFQQMANLATKAGINGEAIDIITPLIKLSKAATIQLGTRLGVDYRATVSCYSAGTQGAACGNCDACYLRKQGFSDAGLEDLTRYQTSLT